MKIGIKTKILFIMLSVAFIPGIVGVSSTYIKGSRVFENSIGNKFLEITRQVSLTIDTMIRKEASEMMLMAANMAVHETTGFPAGDGDMKYLNRYLGIEKSKEGHTAVSIHDGNGKTLYGLGDKSLIRPIDPMVLSLLEREGKVIIGNTIRNGKGEGFFIPIFAPVVGMTEKEGLKGVVATYLHFCTFFEKLGSFTMGETGHINIVVSDGTIAYDPLTPEVVESFPPDTMEGIRKSGESWFTGTDEHGMESVIAFSPLRISVDDNMTYLGTGELYVVLTQPVAEAFHRPIRDVLFSAAIPGFMFASLLILIIYLTLKKIVEPISALKEGASIIGRGDLDYRLNIRTGDEIEELAVEFNKMAAELKELYEGLEEKVRERTLELEASNRELEKANRLKSEFLANMSHELRTPLNSIIGFSEVILDGLYGEINERQRRYLNNIHKSGNHLLELINSILDLSKIEAGKMELILEEFSFQKAMDEVCNIVNPLAEKKGIKLTISVEEGMDVIVADRLKFKQILYNLIGNAIKFTPKGGSVTVHAAREKEMFRISVSDTGVGIAEEAVGLIFEAFRQADGSYSRDYEGTGLGLTLTKKFVEMHGGTIDVKSTVGKGSTFTFTIPVRKAPPRKSDTPRYPVHADRASKTTTVEKGNLVLVIEDNESASELLAMYLHEGGYRVAQAYDGEQGLKLAKQLKPFAITLDIMMPGKDGWELLKELKRNKETMDIPVVIVSMVDNREMGYALGALDTMAKPVSKKDLLDVLSRYTFTAKARKGTVNILAVDDDPKVLEFLRAVLEPEGFNIICSTKGREAVKLAAKNVPDLMILDLMMPEMNGFEVIHELNKNPSTRNLPIIIFSAKNITEEDKRILNGHICKIIEKGSFSKENFLEEIKRIEGKGFQR